MARYGILIDLDRCIGCRTHEVVCQGEGNVTVRHEMLSVSRANPEGTKVLQYLPVIQEKCSSCRTCAQRVKEGLEPRCIAACPARARVFGEFAGLADYIAREKIPHAHLAPF
ncbi:MAG: hypothetical protein HY673_13115 [Chloroflexi bacterium]|nr:hypothetical protein [Chloroflexota bacterium]